jgi:nucleotide-binding universal stress UspA family protein
LTSTRTTSQTAHSTELQRDPSSSALFAVVGFDGSEPARAALDTAAEMIRGRRGHLEVVHVDHIPAYVESSASALVGFRETFPDIAAELATQARSLLDDREPRWHFQRREGSVSQQLAAAARELRSEHGPDATIVIIVGGSTHRAHHIAGSVAVALARADTGFPFLVVPSNVGPSKASKPVAARTPAADARTADTSDYL